MEEEDNYNINYYYSEDDDTMMEDEEYYMEDEGVYMNEEYEMAEEPSFAEKHPIMASLIAETLKAFFESKVVSWAITIAILYLIVKACA